MHVLANECCELLCVLNNRRNLRGTAPVEVVVTELECHTLHDIRTILYETIMQDVVIDGIDCSIPNSLAYEIKIETEIS